MVYFVRFQAEVLLYAFLDGPANHQGLLLASSANRPGSAECQAKAVFSRGGLTVANCTPAIARTETVSGSALEIKTTGYRTPREKGSLSPRPLRLLRDATSDPPTRSDSAFLACASSWQTPWPRFSHKMRKCVRLL